MLRTIFYDVVMHFMTGDSLLALIASQNKSKDVAATPRGRDALLLSANSNNFSAGSSGSKGLERYSELSHSYSHLSIGSSLIGFPSAGCPNTSIYSQ